MEHLGAVCVFFILAGLFRHIPEFVGAHEVCGGHFHASTGVIELSVDTDDGRMLCEWTIEVPNKHQLVLYVRKFELDIFGLPFEIRDGISANSSLIGVYSGRNIPTKITSFGNQLYLRFENDGKSEAGSFNIVWNSSITGTNASDYSSMATPLSTSEGLGISGLIDASKICGGHLHALTGVIRSPNYPENYPRERTCEWIILAPQKHVVVLSVKNFVMDPDLDYLDYLEIRNGIYADSPLIGKYCGENIPKKITSTGNQMYLRFESDSSDEWQGFDIEWKSIIEDDEFQHSSSSNKTTYNEETGYTTEYSSMDTTLSPSEGIDVFRRTWATTTEMSQPDGNCGATLTDIGGSILSPNYPHPYSPMTECNWEIRVSKGSVIRLRIVDLELEADDQCRFDYVDIFEGPDGPSKKFGRYCNSNYPVYIHTTSNVVTIRFRSDQSFAGRGFYMTYQTVCRNKLRGFRGVIESPNFPNDYPHGLNCSWIIEAPIGNKLNLTFSHFDLETGPEKSCVYDYLTVTEGKDDQPNREIGKFCNATALSPNTESTQRQVFLQFYSDGSVSKSGFRLEWIANVCGGVLTHPEGTITFPGYSRQYSQNIDCEWTIEAKRSQSIEITLVDVNLGKPPKCSFGKLSVYNGADVTAPKLIEVCRTSTAIILTSTGNKLFVKLHLDHYDHGSRFEATYKSADIQCGGRFSSQTGLIHSINYPPNDLTSQNCEWLIKVPVNYLVNLTFSDFDIHSSPNCYLNFVKIFDGSSRDARILGSHCDNTLPPSYISSSNELLVVLQRNFSSPTKGFKATYGLACGARIIANDQGILSLDSAVQLHTDIVNCTWIIVAPNPEGHVTFTLTDMQIFSLNIWNEKCHSSSLQIFEGEGTAGLLLGTWCNTKVPPPITSKGHALTIRAISLNRTLYHTKFSGFYSALHSACGGNHTLEDGTIATPGYPDNYPRNVQCIWHLKTSPGSRLHLSFKEFNLIESEQCHLDSVEVREEDGDGKLIGIYCGKNINAINSQKRLWIKFRSSAEEGGKGFVADYSLNYGGHLSGPSGEIASPSYPRPDMLRGEYFWRIIVDSTSSVQITFKDFHLPHSDGECDTYVTIYDGYDVNAPELVTACGMTLPEAVRSSSNVVYIKFFTHVHKEGSWFLLSWLQVSEERGMSEILYRTKRQSLLTFNDSWNNLRLHQTQ